MTRCRETSGILFSHPCERQSQFNCVTCNKPICERHMRHAADKPTCISCVRSHLKASRTNEGRASSGYEHDPYFFYYYYGSAFGGGGGYDDADFALFDGDDGGAAYAMDDDGAWVGS